MQTKQPKIILASGSKYRAELLKRLLLDFDVQPPEIDETKDTAEPPGSLARLLSERKAQAIADIHADALVIGSDQVAEFDHQFIGKPASREDAIDQLMMFSDERVAFHTGVAVRASDKGISLSHVDTTWVHFRQLNRAEVEHYIDIEKPFDCAGSFKCESLGISLFSRIVSDDPTALIGLPLITLCNMLRQCGLELPISASGTKQK